MKLILATILAGTFLVSLPLKAADEAPSGAKADKGDKGKAKDKKDEKKTEKKGDAKAGGGW
jgi:hypothetical protein